MPRHFILILIVTALCIVMPSAGDGVYSSASSLPLLRSRQAGRCNPTGQIVLQPIVDPDQFCPEYLVRELPRSATAAITSIAYAPACHTFSSPPVWCGALFYTRPDEGMVQWVGDYDPEVGAYTRHTFAENLGTPNGLVWHDGAWYVSAGTSIIRLQDDDGDGAADIAVPIIDDLPAGAGGWTNSISIGPDNRLYVAIGASCDACQEADPRRAAVLSINPDGSDEQVVASGLHNAFDLVWHPVSGALWVSESERPHRGNTAPLDEINRITDAGQHFGWPYCYQTEIGITQDITLSSPDPTFCQQTTPPVFTFPAHSQPAGMAFYEGAAFPEYEGDLLVVLYGSWDSRLPSGYGIYRLCFNPDGQPEACLDADGSPLLDASGEPTDRELILPVDAWYGYGLLIMSIQGQSFYPEHPVDIAISPEGYIAISVQEGRIIRLTPPS